ncbi:hypothetical protein AC844_20560 [Salmonella enterica subsp. enterica serovar Hadar]|uniref:hypothetical protein n=1 Tax=Salmonella enterica TaxID=28901 RepID=UPI00035902F0|nr:hypothetical protein [Salmonella enterica]EBV6304153.1 hypothetical protein [Salmonella enterica subsp. enterica serovar Saintpaul]ECE6406049.1 hypothetical protein [Salmonella enterica subsp. enterica]ECI2872327.1 hypothetical protein [Salmonella enterica subsp. enterica serovar Senftenberg]ECS5149400.1 hypothetical protein [Salmonella enterica subsp. enterica serovar Muenchen]AGQ74991.1 hypothetical protein CFSAN002050_04380 [Salmonella enterica subsp. enterica serovar Cubana str. CFSAN00
MRRVFPALALFLSSGVFANSDMVENLKSAPHMLCKGSQDYNACLNLTKKMISAVHQVSMVGALCEQYKDALNETPEKTQEQCRENEKVMRYLDALGEE